MFDEDFEAADYDLPSEITQELYLDWKVARRGQTVAEEMTNPVWDWLIRTRLTAYSAAAQILGDPGYPAVPRWCCSRFGQSSTRLPDGTEIWIGGEHEDHYDPDFYIYNDVIVHEPDGVIEIYGYPENHFPPTDFHTATLLPGSEKILLIGGLSYPEMRQLGTTPLRVYDIATRTFSVVEASGESPGWICRHEAELLSDAQRIRIRGGKVCDEDSGYLDCIDEWELDIEKWTWSRLTQKNWRRIRIEREDNDYLSLMELGIQAIRFDLGPNVQDLLAKEFAKINEESGVDIELKKFPREKIEIYQTLFRPTRDHKICEAGGDDDNAGRHRIQVDGVDVTFEEGSSEILLTVEGDLAKEVVTEIANEMAAKLTKLEEAECRVEWL